jgi:cytoskeleton-associated protein 5
MPVVVDKCFGSSRATTKQKAIALAVDYVEVENSAEGVVVSMIGQIRDVLLIPAVPA